MRALRPQGCSSGRTQLQPSASAFALVSPVSSGWAVATPEKEVWAVLYPAEAFTCTTEGRRTGRLFGHERQAIPHCFG